MPLISEECIYQKYIYLCYLFIYISIKIYFSACQGPFLRNWPTDQSWIALIKRGNCTFNTKIANALGLKASGVLIYDHLDSGQVLHNIKIDPFSIPSVFTYYWKGQELSRLIQAYVSYFVYFLFETAVCLQNLISQIFSLKISGIG